MGKCTVTPLEEKPKVPYATGSYVGNDQYGKNNKNSLTFPSQPQLVYICNSGWEGNQKALFLYGVTETGPLFAGSSGTLIHVTWNGNTMEWYASSSGDQLNRNKTYYYIAFL